MPDTITDIVPSNRCARLIAKVALRFPCKAAGERTLERLTTGKAKMSIALAQRLIDDIRLHSPDDADGLQTKLDNALAAQ